MFELRMQIFLESIGRKRTGPQLDAQMLFEALKQTLLLNPGPRGQVARSCLRRPWPMRWPRPPESRKRELEKISMLRALVVMVIAC